MYQNIFISKKDNTCYLWDDQKGMVTFPFKPYAFRKKSGGIYKSLYGDELEKIYKFSARDSNLFESDVPNDTRVLIDAYEDSDEPSTGHKILYFDIEVSSIGGFPKVDDAENEITAIAFYDSALEKYTALILDKERKIQDVASDKTEIYSFEDEDSLLMYFLTKWEEIQPTIATGWNINGFDTPYLYNRIRKVLGDRHIKRLSPINVVYRNEYTKKIIVAGVSFIDYMELYKKYNIRMEVSYALGYIGKKVVNIEKTSFVGSLDDLYKNDINKYIEYNLNDVKIIVALEKKLQFIEQARAICHKGHVPYECCLTPSRFLEGAILMYLRRNQLVSKNKPVEFKEEHEDLNDDDDEDEKFEGAYVKTPIPGRYDWIFDLDMTAMYPSIIMSLNISPETKVGVVHTIDYDDKFANERIKNLTDDYENLSDAAKVDMSLENYIEERLFKFNSTMFVKNQIQTYKIGSASYDSEGFKNLLDIQNLSVAGNGTLYRKNKQGIIPEILAKWFEERDKLRKLAKKHGDAKEWDKYEFYDQQQKVVKVLLNSVYGCLGLSTWRFHDKDNALAVTITGQELIKNTQKVINRFYKNTIGKKYLVKYKDGTSEIISENDKNSIIE